VNEFRRRRRLHQRPCDRDFRNLLEIAERFEIGLEQILEVYQIKQRLRSQSDSRGSMPPQEVANARERVAALLGETPMQNYMRRGWVDWLRP